MLVSCFFLFIFFFSSRRRHTRWNCDWSSDVCSSDLREPDCRSHLKSAQSPASSDFLLPDAPSSPERAAIIFGHSTILKHFTYPSIMKRVICILAFAVACLISLDARSAAKPITLSLEQTTTLRVGEAAVLHIPSDRRYLPAVNGAWRDVLALAKRSGRDVTFRAVRPGSGVIIIGPDVPDGACVSCATV